MMYNEFVERVGMSVSSSEKSADAMTYASLLRLMSISHLVIMFLLLILQQMSIVIEYQKIIFKQKPTTLKR